LRIHAIEEMRRLRKLNVYSQGPGLNRFQSL